MLRDVTPKVARQLFRRNYRAEEGLCLELQVV